MILVANGSSLEMMMKMEMVTVIITVYNLMIMIVMNTTMSPTLIIMMRLTNTFRLSTTPTPIFQTFPLGAANQTITIVTSKCHAVALIANAIRGNTI